jgi:ribosomal protein L11 methyltransferase
MTPNPPRGAPATCVVRLTTDEQAARRIGDIIAERFAAENVAISLADAGGERWEVAIHFRAAPDAKTVRAAIAAAAGDATAAALRFGRIEAADWVRESLAGLAPVAAGRFIVHGAHDRARIPRNRIGIEIEAALAFGTGHHGTTSGCLLALDRIGKSLRKPRRASSPSGRDGRGRDHRARRQWRILDLGTGSGVLAIAAARALRMRVLATDIDANAVRVACANAALNRARSLVEVAKADGVAARIVRARAPFDLVFANILLAPLVRMAAPLRQLTARDGRVVLSGILASQAGAVIAAYRPLQLERRLDIGGWTTLVFVRRAGVARRHAAS